MKRRLKIAALVLGSLVLVLLLFVAWIVYTEAGLRFAVARLPERMGKVTLRIEYAKNLGSWLEYKILVSAGGVGGTEGRASWTDVLGVLDADVKAEADPPFITSRYGKLAGCENAQ